MSSSSTDSSPAPSPASVTVRAPAKVNLSLVVGPVRPDGFHPLDTVYQAISLYDDVRVTEAETWSVVVHPVGGVDCSGVPLDGGNLAVRAGRALVEHHGLDRAAAIEVHKGIPVAGGLAGGSADAAATLVALDRLWDLRTSDEDLLRLAGELGSDVPFALVGGTAHGTGRGEVVEPVEDTGTWWWVVVPHQVGLSTPAVYAELDRSPGPATGAGSQPVLAALAAGEHA
ncbi:MAG: 4-diphosphocytidyl-2C-methyl-D-erythritol kinase, partial [Marmoricola sp.]|nr:4-diphosphocytidyl-2C-methyl-D-erythritol kinase [Marmoricola sp.]